jgi:hypothetical protein
MQSGWLQALGKVTGETIKADDLPVRNITMADDLKTMTFEYSGSVYNCDLKKYTVTKEREARRPFAWGGDGNRWPWGFRNELIGRPDTSPDKKMTAFIRDYNLWIRNLEEKKEYQLSYDGGIGKYYSASVEWSPDSKKIMAYLLIPAEKHMITYVESSPEGQVQPKTYTYEYPKPGDAVPQYFPQIFDVAGKKHIVVDETMIPQPVQSWKFPLGLAGQLPYF